MGAKKGLSWASIFGASTKKTKKKEQKTFDLQQLVQDTPKHIDVIRETVGKTLFHSIEMYQKLLKSKNFTGQMRRDGEEAYYFILKAAKQDVTNLMALQNEAVKISSSLHNDKAKQIMDTKIILNLDKLILKQAEMIQKIPCSIKIQTSAMIKKEASASFYATTIESMNEGDYKQALVFLLGFNDSIEPQQAKKLYDVAQNAAKTHPIDSDEFLAALKIRLFSQETPQHIDYSVLKNNQLLKDPSLKAIKSNDLMSLLVLLEDAVKFSGYLWEARLRENYTTMILREIDSLINWVTREEAHDNHLPFLRR